MNAPDQFSPITPILEAFAQHHRITLIFDDGNQDRWGEPHYRFFWLNVHGCTCFLTATLRSPDIFYLGAICWGIHSQLGKKQWDAVQGHQVKSAVPKILHEALRWADNFRQEA